MKDKTAQVIDSPESVISDLTYSCFVYNRVECGMSLESARNLWKTADLMEERLKKEGA